MSAHKIEKRYALFGGERYYPSGATGDLLSVHATEVDAREVGERFTAQDSDRWFEVVDLVKMGDSTTDSGQLFRGGSW